MRSPGRRAACGISEGEGLLSHALGGLALLTSVDGRGSELTPFLSGINAREREAELSSYLLNSTARSPESSPSSNITMKFFATLTAFVFAATAFAAPLTRKLLSA